MILIIHGNDYVSSRNFYFEEKNKRKNPVLLEGEGITFDQVFQTAENKTFFEEKTSVLIENFFSENKSTAEEFKKIAAYLEANKTVDVVFWESGEVSKSSLSTFKSASVRIFSYPQILFTFLDNIKPNNVDYSVKLFHELLKNMAAELIFFMIVRQFRIMLNVSDGDKQIDEVKRLAPWQLSKFRKQAGFFAKDRLLKAYRELFVIEMNQKTGKLPYSIEKSIDIFCLGL